MAAANERGGAKMFSKTDRSSRFPTRRRGLRPSTTHSALTAAVVALGLTGATAAQAAAASYSITDLGNLGYPTARAVGINEGGQVAGTSYLAERVEYNAGCSPRHRPCFVHPERPFLWSAGTITNLGSLGGLFAEATAINNLGDVVGNSSLAKGGGEAFLDRGGHMKGLGAFRAAAVNDSDVVAGSMSIPGEGHTDAILDSNGKITDLGLLPGEGGIFTVPTGINNSGEVVGTGDNRESMERAWVYRNGKMTDLGTLGGPQAAASAINSSGEIVGFAQSATDADHGYLDRGGKLTDLGNNVFPYAISNNGVIVGQGGCGNVFILSGGICRNLQTLIPARSGYELQTALGVNNKGQIVVDASTTSTFQNHALLLNPN
jgi:probable HAF family extracellular repeat protein